MTREHVLLAVPVLDTMSPQLAAFVAGLTADTHPNYRFSVRLEIERRGYAFARNCVVQHVRAMADPPHRVWWWDADMLPAPNALELLEVRADIVSAAYPMVVAGTDAPEIAGNLYATYDPKTCHAAYWRPESIRQPLAVPIAAAGFGSILTARSVLCDPRMEYPRTWTDPEGTERTLAPDDPPPVFRFWTEPNGRHFLGEDVDFCRRAKRLGYTILGAPGIINGHRHAVDLNAMWAMQAAAYQRGRRER